MAQREIGLNRCELRLKAIYAALEEYANDHAGVFPGSLSEITVDGIVTHDQLGCPASGPVEGTYHYIRPTTAKVPPQVMVFDAIGNHDDGGNALLTNGNIKLLSDSDIAALAVGAKR